MLNFNNHHVITKHAEHCYLKIDTMSGNYSYKTGTRIGSGQLLTSSVFPLPNDIVDEMFDDLVKQYNREVKTMKASRQARIDAENAKQKAYNDEFSSIKDRYSNASLSDNDIAFLIKLHELSKRTEAIYEQECNHFKGLTNGKYTLDAVDDDDLCSLKNYLNDIRTYVDGTSWSQGYNHGYAEGYDDCGGYDDSMSDYTDYNLGYQAGRYDGGMDA